MAIVYLIGGRASGKTTIGRKLAEMTGAAFADLDETLCSDLGMSVAEIVAAEGWDGFRDHECRILQKASRAFDCGEKNAVLACGGGIVEREENIGLMRELGLVIWLAPDLAVQAARLAADPLAAQRPSLTGADILSELEGIMAKRGPLYAKAAHKRVDSARDVEDVCQEIIKAMNKDKQIVY